MDNQLLRIQSAKSRLAVTCRRLRLLFLVVLVVFAITIGAIAAWILVPPLGFVSFGSASLLTLAPFLLGSLATCFVLFLLERVCWEIGRGESPFNTLRVHQIRLLGVLFLLIAVANFLVAPGSQIGAQDGAAKMAFYSAAPEGTAVDIDFESILVAIVCFALSLVFKYGSTLERETDDLV